MRILAVDYGDARTGLAVCDSGELLASPVGVFHSGDREAVINEIVRQAESQKAELVVVGNPLNMNGTAGPRSELCHALAEDIVLGYRTEDDCIYLLKEKLEKLAQSLAGLSSHRTPMEDIENDSE